MQPGRDLCEKIEGSKFQSGRYKFYAAKTSVNEKKKSKQRTKKKLLLTYVHICQLGANKICIIMYKHTHV